VTLVSTSPPADWRELRHGWRIVAGAAIGMGTGVNLYLLMMSLFVVHLTKQFGWSRGDLGVAGMVAFGSAAVALPVIGRLTDRFGFRRIVIVCVPALAVVYLMIANQPGYYPFHLVLAVCGGIFGSGTGAIAYTRPLIAAFERQRGLALGMATAGTSIASMTVPPLLAAAIAAYGWRAGLYALSALTALVGLPLSLALIGHARDGTRMIDRIEDAPVIARMFAAHDSTLAEAVRGVRFWLLAGALVAVNIPGSGVVGQLAPLVGDKGLPESVVALVMSTYAAGLLAGRFITGFSLDRLPASAVAAVMTFIPAIGIVLLLIPSSSFALVAAAVAMIGMQQGSEIDLIAYFVSRGFGSTHYGAIYGAVGIGGALSTAAALVFFGRVHDVTGSYDVALRVGAVAFCIGAVAFAVIGRLRPQVSRPAALPL
jgi:MFS family permease